MCARVIILRQRVGAISTHTPVWPAVDPPIYGKPCCVAGVVCIFMATLEVRFGTSPSPAPPTGYKGLSVEEEAELITTLSAILETDAVVAAKFDGYQPLQMLLNAGPLVLLFAPVKDDTGAVSG